MRRALIHYHGTPISNGGGSQYKSRFYTGRHAFVSFADQDDLQIALECCQSIALDNGAFTNWKKGGEIDVPAYMAWASSLGHCVDFAVIPDVIGGTVDQNADLLVQWLRAAPSVVGVPVYHMHEPLEYLAELVADWNMIAIGSSGEWPTPGAVRWWRRMSEVMQVVCDQNGRPRCRVHGLRMLSPDVFQHLPLYSADSTNAGVNAGSISRFGIYTPVTAAQRACIIADRIEQYNSPFEWTAPPQIDLL